MKRDFILLLACLAIHVALAEPSMAEKNAAENAAIKKEWESWNAPFLPFAANIRNQTRHDHPCPE